MRSAVARARFQEQGPGAWAWWENSSCENRSLSRTSLGKKTPRYVTQRLNHSWDSSVQQQLKQTSKLRICSSEHNFTLEASRAESTYGCVSPSHPVVLQATIFLLRSCFCLFVITRTIL